MTRTPKKKDDKNDDNAQPPHAERLGRLDKSYARLERTLKKAEELKEIADEYENALHNWSGHLESLLQHAREGDREAAAENLAEMHEHRDKANACLHDLRDVGNKCWEDHVGAWAPVPRPVDLDDLFPPEADNKEGTLFG